MAFEATVHPQKKIFFVGDSAYSKTIYKNIGEHFDYAILPIGAYEPRELLWMSHVDRPLGQELRRL